MSPRLQHKVAFITGACSGIGLATAELFVAEGARVLATDILDEAGRALQQRLGSRQVYAHCDEGALRRCLGPERAQAGAGGAGPDARGAAGNGAGGGRT